MKDVNKKKLPLVLGLLFFVTASFAQLNTANKIPVAPEIKIGKFANGLTYYIRKNSKPEKKVELRLVVKAGSILEDDDQQGLAHFTEHMAFNGSKNFKKNELVSFLQSIGVQFGADLNAYTSFDETVYILPIPTDKPENLEKGFLVLEDWASTVAFENAEIDKERGVVLEESRLGKGANDRMNKVIFPKIFADSKYAQRLPIGKDELLKTFKYDAIKRFYKDWYRPNLMAVIAVGDMDPAEVETLIKKHFEKLKNPSNERPRTYAEIPKRKKSEGVVVTDKEASNNILRVYYSIQKSQPDIFISDYRTSIIKSLFSSMLGQRMQELTQKPNPPFVFGGSGMGGFVHGHELYNSFALISKAGTVPAVDAIVQENERVRKFGFTPGELERAKKNTLRNYEQSYNEREKTESDSFAEELIRNFLTKESIPGIATEYQYVQDFLPTITLEEINQYAAKTIPTNDTKLVVYQGSDKTDFKLPTNEELLNSVTNAEKLPVTAYEEKKISSNLVEKVPQGGSITSENENKTLGTTELVLNNGVKVVLKPTDFKNDQVVMSATRFGGQSLFSENDKYNAQYATSVVGQMGLKDLSPTDLRKALAGKSVSASPRMSGTTEGFSGRSGSTDVETMLQLVYLYFTQPRKDADLFASFVSRQQALFQNLMAQPQAVLQDSVQSILYNKNPRGPRLPSPEDFGKINLDRSFAIYQERFSSAKDFTFFFVGSFDLNKIKPLIASYLGSLPVSNIPTAYKDLGIRPIKGVVKKQVKRGAEPKSFISITFTGETPYSEDAQLKLKALTDVINIKLIETLREDLSGIYGGGMNGNMTKIPYSNYTISVSLPCGPENVNQLIKATFAEIKKIKKDGPTEADLNKVKETYDKKYLEEIKDNNYWLHKLQQVAELNHDGATILQMDQKMKALTVNDIKEAANLFLNEKNYLEVVLYPEK
ncbi:MAG: insulinase family protein [Bacteroidetes bacterium]|nr:insulinase family protein [Bacteroidota bacterium]